MVAIALLTHAGTLKVLPAASWLPIDLTVLSAAIVLIYVAAGLARLRGPNQRLLLMSVFFGSLIPASFALTDSGYAVEKVTKLFTLTLLVAVAPIVLVRTRRQAGALLVALAGMGLLAGGLALANGHRSRFSNRLILEVGASPITLGRSAGVAAVILAVVFFFGERFRVAAGLGSAVCVVAVVLSLSQGPILATGIGVLLVFVSGERLYRRPPYRIVAAIAVALIATIGSMSLLSGQQDRAITSFGTSEAERVDMWRFVISEIPSSVLGYGMGAFAPVSGFESDFPHNLLLELVLEAGWASAAVGSWVIARALLDANSIRSADLLGVAAAGVLAFSVMNSMVSGDLNGNRMMFVALGLMFALHTLEANRSRALREST